MPSSMTSRQIPFRPRHYPPLEKNKLKAIVPTNLRSPLKGLKIAVDPQSTKYNTSRREGSRRNVDIMGSSEQTSNGLKI